MVVNPYPTTDLSWWADCVHLYADGVKETKGRVLGGQWADLVNFIGFVTRQISTRVNVHWSMPSVCKALTDNPHGQTLAPFFSRPGKQQGNLEELQQFGSVMVNKGNEQIAVLCFNDVCHFSYFLVIVSSLRGCLIKRWQEP